MTYSLTDNCKTLMSIGLLNGQIPRILFKYRDAEMTKLFLENYKLKFSSVKSLNDPFEGRMNGGENITYGDIVNYLRSQKIDSNIIRIKAKEMLSDSDQLKQNTNNAINSVVKDLGIFCCTTKCDDILMWAHYANSHKGFCLEFDVSEDLDLFCFPQKVVYDSKYPVFNYFKNYKETVGEVTKAIYHKFKEWEYEEEYRVVKMKCADRLLSVNPQALKSIIIGCNTSQDDIDEVMVALKNKDLSHVTLKKAEIDAGYYRINIIDY